MTEPRAPNPTVGFIDDYCQWYRDLFVEVRSFEAFKQLHVGMISEVKRKSLPAIAKAVGLENHQSMHHCLSESPWQASQLQQARLQLILQVLQGQELILIIDDTGDRKKGQATDYVARQYIGNLGKIENGIVAVTAYGLYKGITLPLLFEVYKPQKCLNPEDIYRSKPEIAATLIHQLQQLGFRFQLVLADSLYGESSCNFVNVLYALKLNFVVAIRSNHAVWLPREQQVRCNRWRQFERVFSDGQQQTRYIREVIFGKRRTTQFWQITTDPQSLPKNSTWMVMSYIPGVKYHQVGNLYGLRNWVEYGLKYSKNELGWADFRLTTYASIQKWWELVMSAYLMVSLYAIERQQQLPHSTENLSPSKLSQFSAHPWWNDATSWKPSLNNLRLILQPFVLWNLLKPWLTVFPVPRLSLGFAQLIGIMNQFKGAVLNPYSSPSFLFSSA